MFYEEKWDKALRFGDVLKGYPSTTPVIKEPILEEATRNYKIEVDMPIFSVVMDPCCQIGKKTISLTPLVQVRESFFDNPYFSEDLTRINRKMKPEQVVPPPIWESFSLEEKEKRLAEGDTYALYSLFIYEKHDLFPKYALIGRTGEKIDTGYYLIDFRNIYKLRCDKINSPTDAPLNSKILQLSVKTRSELRDKISFHYGNPPPEDKALED